MFAKRKKKKQNVNIALSSHHNPDSLKTLLQKAHAILTINTENITYIESCKGQKLLSNANTHYKRNHIPEKKQKTQPISQHDNDMFQLVDNTSTTNADGIIAAWR